ncbi:ASCH domain-containing protein [Chryseobacterium indoltheticum]|uniref:ASCH domain n=1 Tax=Chryseobacterium indoltheticum TaxID=254 RepID=A0A381FIK9_9FLAO|nr:ASCH domain-containing protein [Chryseobacterium indoltheticum]AZA75951.1 ASCH domain-containing protein [Chryseobacterium indoltheticum]SIQ36171.1 ASCH domain-containing protein [Chryseobacterium indoltheticum]SUX45982.1 ASCH domain [Chryseobacterium indoltheticum]
MKALSIKQPWASIIAYGIKDIENRTWKTNFRGRIFIHASAKIVEEVDFTTQQTALLFENGIWHPDRGFTEELNITSAIIGEVIIVDCVINHESIWADKTFMYECDETGEEPIGKPIYNWVLENAILYDKPIFNVKGKLSFWNFEK